MYTRKAAPSSKAQASMAQSGYEWLNRVDGCLGASTQYASGRRALLLQRQSNASRQGPRLRGWSTALRRKERTKRASARPAKARERRSYPLPIANERTSKKLAATAQPSRVSQSGWDLRESQQGSSTSAASSTAGCGRAGGFRCSVHMEVLLLAVVLSRRSGEAR
jgi:hypothetical protein